MLEIKNISKKYVTGGLTQIALDDVTLNLRSNEFVAILGPSGSGKTTLLNIVGGLDQYDSGDLVIDGVSTKRYKDRDWDSYRNHSIGFVFQSYNLIPHQSILANVELALTISGISKAERKKRATEALAEVGLGDQVHKRPNQLSGGQMQRVAIARALVNNPKVLLADEPTGALDTKTSVQIMNLLKEVAKDRLVIMVTHNPELADDYATRIVKLRDGQVVSDTNPFNIEDEPRVRATHKNMGKASMSFLTALSLSFNNLRTKKGRTLLTSFAGSIGIIGIALILSLSSGVNAYIGSVQKDTMASYPIQIDATALDLSSMIASGREMTSEEVHHDLDGVYSSSADLEIAKTASASISENNLTPFKTYLDDPDSPIHQYIGTNGIVYSYAVDFDAYVRDPEGKLVNTDGSTFETTTSTTGSSGMSPFGAGMGSGMGSGGFGEMPPMMSALTGASSSNFQELIPSAGGETVGAVITDSYEMLAGKWPTEYNELTLVLDENNEVASSVLYELGLLPSEDYKEIRQAIKAGDDVTFEKYDWSYDDVLEHSFTMLTASDYYVQGANGQFDLVEDSDGIDKLLENGTELKIVGIIRPAEEASNAPISGSIGYTNALTKHIIQHTNESAVVKAQEATPETNVLNGVSFEPKNDRTKVADTVEYLTNLPTTDKATLASVILQSSGTDFAAMGVAPPTTETELAAVLDTYLQNDPDQEVMLTIYEAQISPGSYDDNLAAFGVVSLDSPSSIGIYADSFDDKDKISAAITDYNDTASKENQIVYTDFVGLLMSSVTTIVNVISYVLIAFVAVSLVVSSIMIGIITFISVLERTKEIGVLRAIGASKRNISQVFNAETLMVGLLAGVIGVGVTLLTLLPANALIHSLTGIDTVNAALPIPAAIILVVLSTVLTLIAGIFPSRMAAKKDPVEALRSE